MTINRRSLITGLISLVAAPAIVRAGNLMPIKALPNDFLHEAGHEYVVTVYVNPGRSKQSFNFMTGMSSDNPFATISEALDFINRNGGTVIAPQPHQIVCGAGIYTRTS